MDAGQPSARAAYFREQAKRLREMAESARGFGLRDQYRDIAAQYEALAGMVDQGLLKP